MTRFLLDTHVWLWLQSTPGRVPADLRSELADERNELFLSAASSWEIAIKRALGKLALPEPARTYVPDRMRRSGTSGLTVEHVHALRVADLPPLHADPFDRMLIAQALDTGLRIVTADPAIRQYDVDVAFVDI